MNYPMTKDLGDFLVDHILKRTLVTFHHVLFDVFSSSVNTLPDASIY